jgi:arylsulfatase A-like enzyme
MGDMKMTHTSLLILTLLCVFAPQREGIAAEKPNVLFIICDDLNDYVGVLGGHPQARTPNIDRLFKSGVSFTQAHCNIPICAPSRASLFTGLYPHTSRNFGFENWDENPVLKNNRTLMDHFRANGYQTMGTGKIMHNRDRKEWQQYGNPVDYGPLAKQGEKEVAHPDTPAPFRDDFGSIDGSFGPLKNLQGSGFSWITGSWQGMHALRYVSDDDRDPTHDELNAKWAVEQLRELASKPKSKPFFMGVGFMRPHTPLIVPQKYFDLFPLETIQLPEIKAGDIDDTFKHTVSADGDDRGRKIHDSLVASYNNDRELALKKFIQAYLACIASVDDHVGLILDTLDASPLKNNTIVILTSDHGWQMGQKDYLYKNSLWQESTRIPLAIRAPGVAKVGGECPRPVSLIDLYPTLVDLCGLSADTKKNVQGRALDGHSLKPLLADPENGIWTGPDTALTALSKWGKNYDPAQQSYALRSEEWRYIRYENGKEELYHVADDPREWNNLATKPLHLKQLEEFRSQLLAMIPASKLAAEPGAEMSAAVWKDTFFKTHPGADANGDGTLSWPEYKDYKKRLDAGEVMKPKANAKANPTAPAAPGRLQTSGTFGKSADGGLIFTDQSGGQVYYVIKELAGSVESHMDKPVKIVANVKNSTKGKAMMMVHIVSIQAAEMGTPKANSKANASAPSVSGRLQTNGTFSKLAEGGLIFTDQSGGQVYYVIKELAGSVESHLDMPVKIVANVKDSTKSKAKMMVHIVSIKAGQ